MISIRKRSETYLISRRAKNILLGAPSEPAIRMQLVASFICWKLPSWKDQRLHTGRNSAN